MLLHEMRLKRLKIGDALVSPTGYQIDYIQPSDTHDPCFVVMRGAETLLMTKNASVDSAGQVVAFLSEFAFETDPGDEWDFVASGAEDNLLWDQNISEMSIACPEAFFAPSEFTGALRTQATIVRRRNHYPLNGEDGEVERVQAERCRGTVVGREDEYRIGRLYALREDTRAKLLPGLVRLTAIKAARLDTLSPDHILPEGFSSWRQFQAAWTRHNGRFAPTKRCWVLTFTRVFTTWPEAVYPVEPQAVHEKQFIATMQHLESRQQQLPLPMAVAVGE